MIKQKGVSLVPTKMYFKGNHIKVEIGIGKGKKLYDKREDIAKKDEGAIIVGRCADYVLSGAPNLVRIYISADFDARVKTVMERHSYTEAQAKDIIVKTDKRRASYYNFYTGNKWGKFDNYDMAINSSTFGIEETARIITAAIEKLIADQE